MEHGEKCNKYFLQQQNINISRKNISKIMKNDGTHVMSTTGILTTLKEYYNSIFNDDAPPSDDITLSMHMRTHPYPKLTKCQQTLCEGPINEDELYEAIGSFQNGKAPGLDGIPVEVYKTFFKETKDHLLACFNFSLETGCQSDSQREGLISLLLKFDAEGKEKDPVKLKNWEKYRYWYQ